MLLVLRQVITDRVPRCLRADENVLARADCRIIEQRSHGNVDKGAAADDRIQQRAAVLAVTVVAIFVATDHEAVVAFGDIELVAFYPRERLESRTSRTPTVRAVAIRSVDEFVHDGVVNGAAKTPPGKRALTASSGICHATFLRVPEVAN